MIYTRIIRGGAMHVLWSRWCLRVVGWLVGWLMESGFAHCISTGPTPPPLSDASHREFRGDSGQEKENHRVWVGCGGGERDGVVFYSMLPRAARYWRRRHFCRASRGRWTVIMPLNGFGNEYES
jgi:hypothetical protein